MKKQDELWRRLRVGDRIRIPEIPSEFLQKGYCIRSETIRVYKKLIARNRPLRVFQIDEYGHPWIYCRFKTRRGDWEIHWLAVNHGGLIRVNSRHNK